MCDDWHLADDLVSEAVMRLCRHWSRVRRADNPDAYAQKILARCWLTERRRAWWRRERTTDTLPVTPHRQDERVPLKGPTVMREQFDRIIGTPPPSTIDTHALARRVRRTRDARLVGSFATAAVAAGITGVLLVGNEPPAPAPVAKDPTVAVPESTVAVPPDNRIQLKSGTRVEGEASARQLAALVEKAFTDVAPGVVWGGPLTVRYTDGKLPEWAGSGAFTVGGRSGTVFVMALGGVPVTGRNPALTCPPGTSGCVQGTSPGGREMMTFDGGDTADGSRLVRAAVGLPGHRVFIIHHTPDQPTSPLAVAQLLQIADAVAAQIK
jgi:hypothetical protein